MDHHIRAILLEEALVELTSPSPQQTPTLTIVTKTKHRFLFRGRSAYIMNVWLSSIQKLQQQIPSAKELFTEWKKEDKGTKDLINCLPRQAFPEKFAEGDASTIELLQETLQSRGQTWSMSKVIGRKLTLIVLLGSVGSDIQIIGVALALPPEGFEAFPWPLYINESRRVYNALNCNYGIKFLLSRNSLAEATEAMKHFKTLPDSGDRGQLGGLCLIGALEGVVFEWHQQWAGQEPPVAEMNQAVYAFLEIPQDRWSITENEVRSWSEVLDPTLTQEKSIIEINKDQGWIYETGRNSVTYATPHPLVEETQLDLPVYKAFFVDRQEAPMGFNLLSEDLAYWGEAIHSLVSKIEEFIVITEQFTIGSHRKAIAFTTVGTKRLLIPKDHPNPIDAVKQKLFKNEENFVHTREIVNSELLQSKLLEYEQNELKERMNYKFGVMYMKAGQEDDEDLIYSNVTTSPEYEKFLSLLGDRIELATWDKFMGGLQKDRTGTHSVFTTFDGKQIMFHVSTLLPFSEAEVQQLDRKRHLGNDVVVLVFKEPGCLFKPKVYIVIEPIMESGGLSYRIEVVNKSGVNPYGPFLPSPSIHHHSEDTRNFLLAKMINAERSAMYAPSFREKMARTRSAVLRSIVAEVDAAKESGVTVNDYPGLHSDLSEPNKARKNMKQNMFGQMSGTSVFRGVSRRILPESRGRMFNFFSSPSIHTSSAGSSPPPISHSSSLPSHSTPAAMSAQLNSSYSQIDSARKQGSKSDLSGSEADTSMSPRTGYIGSRIIGAFSDGVKRVATTTTNLFTGAPLTRRDDDESKFDISLSCDTSANINKLRLRVSPTESYSSLLELVAEATEKVPEALTLTLDGKTLSDSSPIALKAGDVIHVQIDSL